MATVSSQGVFLRRLAVLSACISLVVIYTYLFASSGSGLPSILIPDLSEFQVGDTLGHGKVNLETASPVSRPPEASITAVPLSPSSSSSTPGSSNGQDWTTEPPHHHHPPPSALETLCSTQTQWRPNLTLHCHSRCGPDESSFCGGLNNARDRVQTCVRLAIDAGATTVVIPSLAARSETALWAIDPSHLEEEAPQAPPGGGGEEEEKEEKEEKEPIVVVCAEAWFSIETLRAALATRCPQLRVEAVCRRPPGEDGVGQSAAAAAVVEMPERLLGGERFDVRQGHRFREAVDKAVGSGEGAGPVVVEFGDPYVAWNYTVGGEIYTVFKELFRAVDYNPDLLALGHRITQTPQLRNNPYVGVHLRAEADWPASWGSLDEQTQMYAAELVRLRESDRAAAAATATTMLSTVYVSCGNRTAIEQFRRVVAPMGFLVLDKWVLLEEDGPEGVGLVETLPFDQKAVVEYVPLVEGKYFLGLRLSSMSVIIAQSRTLEEPGDFFETFVDGGTVLAAEPSGGRMLEVRGNENTRLLVISGITDW